MPTPDPYRSALAEGLKTYPSRDAAAIAALRAIPTGKLEMGGGVLFNPQTQQYAYTNPVGQQDDAHFAAHIQVPAPWQLQAIYHDHPAAPRSTQFSADDIGMAQRAKLMSYILARYDNRIRMFDPASSPVSKSVEGNFAPGTLIDEAPAQPATPPIAGNTP